MVSTISKIVKEQWKLSLFVLLFLPLLIRLGFWQLDRAEERQQLLAVYQYQQNLAVENIEQLSVIGEEIRYRPVRITGEYDPQRYWLLDNQSRAGKVGYEVIVPLQTTNAEWILVNRGWVAAPRLRSDLPVIDTPLGSVTIEGYFSPPSKNAIFTQPSNNNEQWPKRIIELNMTNAEIALSAEIYPQLLRINSDSAGAFVTDWPVINTSPEKHYGYAVQWFLMALALVFLYAWAIIRNDNNKK
ncbi:SURF1 family protein [Eionea flava]